MLRIEWKRLLGIPVEIISVDTDPSYATVQQEIEEAYLLADPRPEYVLLVGDPNIGSGLIPGDYIETFPNGFIITDRTIGDPADIF